MKEFLEIWKANYGCAEPLPPKLGDPTRFYREMLKLTKLKAASVGINVFGWPEVICPSGYSPVSFTEVK